MNRKAFLFRLGGATAALVAGPLFGADATDTKTPVPIDHLPAPVAEPADASSYAPPVVDLGEGPSAADVGPAQKPFVMASQIDNLANNPNAPITNTIPGEVMALDKHIRVPVVHDVQDDSSYKGGQNDSLLYEIKYLNWGAITSEQLKARQGQYFTITFVNSGPRSDFTTLFEYRQVKSMAVVRSLTQDRPHVHGAARAYFAVVNQAYLAYGPVSAWRFTVRHGNTVVAEAKSFLW